MDVVTIDFETYYDKDYSLSKMTTEHYIRDPRFEIICAAVKVNDEHTVCYTGAGVDAFFRGQNYSNKAVLCHNTAFDGAILSWKYGIKPRLWLDTLSMARPEHRMTTGCSLKALAWAYRLGRKGDELVQTKGMHYNDFSPEQLKAFEGYCKADVDLTRKLFIKLVEDTEPTELKVIDQTIRMFTEPKLELDPDVLAEHLQKVRAYKAGFMEKLGGEAKARSILMSNPKFAALLKRLGVEPPQKTSVTTGKQTYAFARTDPQFTALLDHPKAPVRAIVEARLGTKSTIEETRTNRFLDMSKRGPVPVMLHYYGAHTGRFSGGDKMNFQNLPRGGALRKSLVAPDGHVIVVCDLSQIEARLLAWVAGQNDLVQAFRGGRDVYSEFATDVYQRPISKADKQERHVGKTSILGLGYSMSAKRFQQTLATGYIPMNIDINIAQDIVGLYRRKYDRIPAFWNRCKDMLVDMGSRVDGTLCDNLIDYSEDKVYLPNGMYLKYPMLRCTPDRRNFEYLNTPQAVKKYLDHERENLPWVKLYGAKVTENLVQALARIVIVGCMVKIGRRYPIALQVHDDIVCVVPEAQGEACKTCMMDVMSTPPAWAPDLPLACEAGIGRNYNDTK